MIDRLREAARQLGFVWGGVAPAVDSTGFTRLTDWIAAGYAGEMHYFAERIDAYRNPHSVLAGVRSIVVLGMPYDAGPSPGGAAAGGRVARYAWADTDYHDVLHPKLKQLCQLLAAAVSGSHSRGVVDTAPLMEREVAQLAGFGWRGKNTLLLNKQLGSYFFLACLLTDIPLPVDRPHHADHCGTCTACLDSCPTSAFPQPGVLDATRCISYLTIEHRSPVPAELRGAVGDWLFGCDVCQEVCPWNTRPARTAPPVAASAAVVELYALFDLTEQEFRDRFRQTPLWRPRRRGLLRNAALVLGNSMCDAHVPALNKGLHDCEPLVRGAAAWALGRHATVGTRQLLTRRLDVETAPSVRAEINAALRQSWQPVEKGG